MFISGRWARAFFDFLDRENGNIEDALGILRIFSSWVKSLPGAVFGSSSAEKVESLVRRGMAGIGHTPELEAALRLFVLMIRKNVIHHLDAVVDEVQKLLNKKNRVLLVTAEYVTAPGENFETRIKEAVKRKTGAARVDLTGRAKPELIGGYRLRIGDEMIDASIRSQLHKLEAFLNAAVR